VRLESKGRGQYASEKDIIHTKTILLTEVQQAIAERMEMSSSQLLPLQIGLRRVGSCTLLERFVSPGVKGEISAQFGYRTDQGRASQESRRKETFEQCHCIDPVITSQGIIYIICMQHCRCIEEDYILAGHVEDAEAIEATGWCAVGLLLLASQCKENGFGNSRPRLTIAKKARDELIAVVLNGMDANADWQLLLQEKLNSMLKVEGGNLGINNWLSIYETWYCSQIMGVKNIFFWEYDDKAGSYSLREPSNGLTLEQYR
jgi:hypothetical protein